MHEQNLIAGGLLCQLRSFDIFFHSFEVRRANFIALNPEQRISNGNFGDKCILASTKVKWICCNGVAVNRKSNERHNHWNFVGAITPNWLYYCLFITQRYADNNNKNKMIESQSLLIFRMLFCTQLSIISPCIYMVQCTQYTRVNKSFTSIAKPFNAFEFTYQMDGIQIKWGAKDSIGCF